MFSVSPCVKSVVIRDAPILVSDISSKNHVPVLVLILINVVQICRYHKPIPLAVQHNSKQSRADTYSKVTSTLS